VEPANPDPLQRAGTALQKKLEDIKEDVDEENKEATNDKLKPKEIISKIAESKAQSELRSLLDSLENQLTKPPAQAFMGSKYPGIRNIFKHSEEALMEAKAKQLKHKISQRLSEQLSGFNYGSRRMVETLSKIEC